MVEAQHQKQNVGGSSHHYSSQPSLLAIRHASLHCLVTSDCRQFVSIGSSWPSLVCLQPKFRPVNPMRVSLPPYLPGACDEYEMLMKRRGATLHPTRLSPPRSESVQVSSFGEALKVAHPYEIPYGEPEGSVLLDEFISGSLHSDLAELDLSGIRLDRETHEICLGSREETLKGPLVPRKTYDLKPAGSLWCVEQPITIGQYASGYRFSFDHIFSASNSSMYQIPIEQDGSHVLQGFRSLFVIDEETWNNIKIELDSREHQAIATGQHIHLHGKLKVLSDQMRENMNKRQLRQILFVVSERASREEEDKLCHPRAGDSNTGLSMFCLPPFEIETVGDLEIRTVFDDNITEEDLLQQGDILLMSTLDSRNIETIREEVMRELVPKSMGWRCKEIISIIFINPNHINKLEQPAQQPSEHLLVLQSSLNFMSLIDRKEETFLFEKNELETEKQHFELKNKEFLSSLFAQDLECLPGLCGVGSKGVGGRSISSDNITRFKEVELGDISGVCSVFNDKSLDIASAAPLAKVLNSSFLSDLYLSFSKSIGSVKKLKLLNNILLLPPTSDKSKLKTSRGCKDDFDVVFEGIRGTFLQSVCVVVEETEYGQTDYHMPIDVENMSTANTGEEGMEYEEKGENREGEREGVRNPNPLTAVGSKFPTFQIVSDKFEIVQSLSQHNQHDQSNFIVPLMTTERYTEIGKPMGRGDTNLSGLPKFIVRRSLEPPQIIPLHDNVSLTPWHSGLSNIPPMRKIKKVTTRNESTHLTTDIIRRAQHIEYPPFPPSLIEGSQESEKSGHEYSEERSKENGESEEAKEEEKEEEEEKGEGRNLLMSDMVRVAGIKNDSTSTYVLPVSLPIVDKRRTDGQGLTCFASVSVDIEKASQLSLQLELLSLLIGGKLLPSTPENKENNYGILNEYGQQSQFFDLDITQLLEYDDVKRRPIVVPNGSIWSGTIKGYTGGNGCAVILPHSGSIELEGFRDEFVIDFTSSPPEEMEYGATFVVKQPRPYLACATVLTESYYYLEALLRRGIGELDDLHSISFEETDRTYSSGIQHAIHTVQRVKEIAGDNTPHFIAGKCLADVWLLALLSPEFALKRLLHILKTDMKRVLSMTKDKIGPAHAVCHSLCNVNQEACPLVQVLKRLVQEELNSAGVKRAAEILSVGKPLYVVSPLYSKFKKIVSKVFGVDKDAVSVSNSLCVEGGDCSHVVLFGFYDKIAVHLPSPAIVPLSSGMFETSPAEYDCSVELVSPQSISGEDEPLGRGRTRCLMVLSQRTQPLHSFTTFIIIPTMNRASPLSHIAMPLGYGRIKPIDINSSLPNIVADALGRMCRVRTMQETVGCGAVRFDVVGGRGAILVFDNKDINIKFLLNSIIPSCGGKTRAVCIIVKEKDGNTRWCAGGELITGSNLLGLALRSQYNGAPLIYVHDNYELTQQIFRVLSVFPDVADSMRRDDGDEGGLNEKGEIERKETPRGKTPKRAQQTVHSNPLPLSSPTTPRLQARTNTPSTHTPHAAYIPHDTNQPAEITPDMVPFTFPKRSGSELTRASHGTPLPRSIALRKLPDSSQTVITWADSDRGRKAATGAGVAEVEKSVGEEEDHAPVQKDTGRKTRHVGFQGAKW